MQSEQGLALPGSFQPVPKAIGSSVGLTSVDNGRAGQYPPKDVSGARGFDHRLSSASPKLLLMREYDKVY